MASPDPDKPVNPRGYIAGGDLDFSKRPRPRPKKMAEKSMWIAYLLWFIGGWGALHLLYLRRDRQAFIWLCTCGGYLGIGLLRDLFRIPAYVTDINSDEKYMEELSSLFRKHKKPPFNLTRFVGQILVGNSWSYLIAAAIPNEEIFGLSLTPLTHLSPFGTALAVWVIGNIGREKGEMKWALIGAFGVLPVAVFFPPIYNWSAMISAVLFNSKGKEWRRNPYPKVPFCRRMMTLTACWLVFCSLWASYLYFNATLTNEQGEKIKLRDAAKHFLNSPMFLEFKTNLGIIYNDIKENGFKNAWTKFVELLDPMGEKHALKVLGLEKGATQSNITAAYRKLALHWHPDRHPGEDKDEAQERFMEIQGAYEKLSKIKKRRNRKNTLSSDTEWETAEDPVMHDA